ncbi:MULTISPECIES: hypothetical protein [Bacillaceae]|uniref:Uncharacterized protein n=1 Tax=Peribacillus huizhouensis TaxID=1501239 RepID=A0ABR6CW54_9BACI|nr:MULTISPECIES: hypothetical protein [Bacillaceae]MBA9029253.1 hypothetical protein [Peribacillus huizhouensis]
MNDNSSAELRKIRITLVILTVILALATCSHNESNPVYYDNEQTYPQFSYSNIIDFGDGDFGVLRGDSNSNGEEIIIIYHFDKTSNNITFKKEQLLSELHER